MSSIKGYQAYSVSFTTRPTTGPGRHHKVSKYETACVIATSVSDAGEQAERYCKAFLPKFHVEEIRLDDDTVIINTDEDGALA